MSKVDPEDVVAAIHDHDDPVVTATELAENLPVTSRTVTNRLRELAAGGEVERKDVGGRAVVYWLPGTRKPRPDARPRERSLAADQADLEASVRQTPPQDDIATSDSSEPVDDEQPRMGKVDVEAIVDELDLPGSGDRVEMRRNGVRACLRYLRERGEAQRSDWIEDVYPDHPAGFGSSGGWWNAIGKQGLTAVAEKIDAVDAPGEGSHIWYWRE